MRRLGCQNRKPRRHQEGLSQACEEAAPGFKQEGPEGRDEVRRAERRLRDRRRRGQAQGVRPRRDRRGRQATLPGVRRLQRLSPGRRTVRRARGKFRELHLGAGRHPPLRLAGGRRCWRKRSGLRGHPQPDVRHAWRARRTRGSVRGGGHRLGAARAGRHRDGDDHLERSRARRHTADRSAQRQGNRIQDSARHLRMASR